MVGYQASARGGVIRARLADERVYLSGQAFTVLHRDLISQEALSQRANRRE